MSHKRIVAIIAIVLTVGGLATYSASAFESHQVSKPQTIIMPHREESGHIYLDNLPLSMMSIDPEKGIYYLGVGSGILASWDYGTKSTSEDRTLNQEFIVFLDKQQLKEFQAMGGGLGPITELQAESLSYYVVIYSQRLTISELEAGHPKPKVTFTAALR
jgi:hypothetical protein